MLKHFFTKPHMSRREARWLDFFSNFGITGITLRPGKIHALGDTLSKAPHAPSIPTLSNIQVTHLSLPHGFNSNALFGPIRRGLKGQFLSDPVQKGRVQPLLPSFTLEDDRIMCNGKLCVPRRNIRDILNLAHDCNVAGHLAFSKTLARLESFNWKEKYRDVKLYCRGCPKCQANKDSRTKPFGVREPLSIPSRRWSSVASDFIAHLPKTSKVYDAIITYVDRFTKRVHFAASKCSDTAVDVAYAFYNNIFRYHGLPDSIISDRGPKFIAQFWTHLMDLCGVKLKMSSRWHSQTTGSSEIMNRMVENYIRCYCSLNRSNWDELLTASEFSCNSTRIEYLQFSPFGLDLGWQPKSPLDCLTSQDCPNASVNAFRRHIKASFDDARF